MFRSLQLWWRKALGKDSPQAPPGGKVSPPAPSGSIISPIRISLPPLSSPGYNAAILGCLL